MPNLDFERPVPLAEFDDLISDYMFPKPDWLHCQLVDEKGKCKRLHGWGWITVLKNGDVGCIGHNCAEEHFAGDPRFADKFRAAAARLDREITINMAVKRLRGLLADAELPASVRTLVRRQNQLEHRLANIRGLLRAELLKRLTARAKAGRNEVAVLMVEVKEETDEKTKRTKKVIEKTVFRVGSFAGLAGLNLSPLSRIGGKLGEANAALTNAVASIDQPIKSLQKWASAIDYVRNADMKLSHHESMLERFCQLENLKLLWLLTADRFQQLAAVYAGLEIHSGRHITEPEATATHDAWKRDVRAALQGREFEILG